jgi:hypothetical protein
MLHPILIGLVLLVIGDSHMAGPDYLISTLHDALIAEGAMVHSYGFCGAQGESWVYGTTVSCGRAERHGRNPPLADRSPQDRTWPLQALVERHHPNLIVVELGDTLAAYGQPDLPRAWIYEQVRTLTGRIRADNIPCVWVGPAWGDNGYAYHKTVARVTEISRFLARSVAPCRYIDSTKFSRPGEWATTDGQHLTASGYRAWGKDIAQAIAELAPAVLGESPRRAVTSATPQ